MSSETLARNLDGARFVKYVQEWEAVFAWFGGHGVNVYSAETSTEIEFFNVGDYETGETTLGDVQDGIRSTLRTWEQEYA